MSFVIWRQLGSSPSASKDWVWLGKATLERSPVLTNGRSRVRCDLNGNPVDGQPTGPVATSSAAPPVPPRMSANVVNHNGNGGGVPPNTTGDQPQPMVRESHQQPHQVGHQTTHHRKMTDVMASLIRRHQTMAANHKNNRKSRSSNSSEPEEKPLLLATASRSLSQNGEFYLESD